MEVEMKTKKKSVLWLALVVALGLVTLTGCGAVNLPLTQLRTVREVAATPTPVPDAAPPITSGTLADLEGTLEQIYQDVSPSVVYVEVSKRQAIGSSLSGSGSGFVWDKTGHIVTNNHVVEGADKIEVTFADGTTVPATLVGANRDSDLAVIKVDVPASELHPVSVGDSTQVKVGEIAIAIGNPFGLENTMTVGFISALGRSLPVESDGSAGPTYRIPDIIQTDAPINPGNSGGVLVNDQGEVIGVTAAIASPVRASAGIGFVIPSAIVEKVVPVLIKDGRYAVPWLGISGGSLDPDLAQEMGLDADQRGALVVDVVPGGPADAAGLRGSDRQVTVDGADLRVGGDVIIAIGGQTVETFDDLVAYLFSSTEVGQQVSLTVLRDGRQQQMEVTLAERPAQESEPSSIIRETSDRAWLGISGVALSPEIAQAMDLPQDQTGVLIVEVVSDSPADAAGLRGGDKTVTIHGQQLPVGGDVITAWDGKTVAQMEELQALVSESHPGQHVTIAVLRNGVQENVQVTLEARPMP
jgi:serine protease Do